MIRVRFAHVPSGNLHPGGLKIFLANWIFANKLKGEFILRFEDTNPRISFYDYEESFFRTIKWLGFSKNFPCYHQSQRHNIYYEIANFLIDKGYAYYCFCERDELIERLKKSGFSSHGEFVRYDRHCLNLSPDEISKKLKAGKRPCIRFKIHPLRLMLKDLIKGMVTFDTSLLGDFVILRKNGTGTYNFAVVVDDIMMKITHVIRGEEQLSNLPKQLLIFKALQAPVPEFAHIPLLLPPNGSPSIFELKNQGVLPEAILNYIFCCGLYPSKEHTLFTFKDMCDNFTLSGIPNKSNYFDIEKLKYFNSMCIKKMEIKSLKEEIINFSGLKGLKFSFKRYELIDKLLRELQKRYVTLLNISIIIFSILNNFPVYTETAKEFIKNNYRLLKDLETIITQDISFKKIKKAIFIQRKTLGKLVRIVITGQVEGIPLELLLKWINLNSLRKKLEYLINFSKEHKKSFILDTDLIEENRIKFYFEKKFNLKVRYIRNLGGFRNTCYRIICYDRSFVFKKALSNDFRGLLNEKEALIIMGEKGISPKNPFLDLSKEFFSEPVLIYEWQEGKTFSKINISHYKNLAKLLCQIHSVQNINLPYLSFTNNLYSFYLELVKLFNFYLQAREEEGLEEDEFTRIFLKYILAFEKIVDEENKYWEPGVPIGLLHRDLRPSNFIIQENRIFIVDWEDAASGDPAFDISWLFKINNMNYKQSKSFLESYFAIYQKIYPDDIFFQKRVEVYSLLNQLFWPLTNIMFLFELLKGEKKVHFPLREYLAIEIEKLYNYITEAFNLLNKKLFLSTEIITSRQLMFCGKILSIPPELKK